jgi:hypothetical protein
MCKYNEIDFLYEDDDKENINVTYYNNFVDLTEDSKMKIREMYSEDCELYEKLVKLNKPFCKLSELV